MKLNRRMISVILVLSLVLGLMPSVFAVKNEQKYGSIALQGYTRALTFFDGLLPASNTEGKWGLIDANGNVVVPFKYQSLGPMGKNLNPPKKDVGLFWASDEQNNTYIFNKEGQKLMNAGQGVVWYQNGFWFPDSDSWYTWDLRPSSKSSVCNYDARLDAYDWWTKWTGCYEVRNNQGKYGVVDLNFHTIIPMQYDYIEKLSDNVVAMFRCKNWNNSKYDLYDGQGNRVTNYDNVEDSSQDVETLLVTKGSKKGVVDKNGQVVLPLLELNWDSPISALLSDGSISVATYNEVDGNYTDMVTKIYKNGTLVKTIKNYMAELIAPNILLFTTDGATYGLMNQNGRILIPQLYSSISATSNGSYITALGTWPNTTYGLVDGSGQFIYPQQYAQITDLGDGRFLLYDGTYYGVGNSCGDLIIPVKYQNIQTAVGICILFDGNKYSAIDKDANVIIKESAMPIKQLCGRDVMFDEHGTGLLFGMQGWKEYDRIAYGATTTVALCYETDQGRATTYVDYETGEVKGTVPYWASVPNADGYYAYIGEDDYYRLGNINDASGKPTTSVTIGHKGNSLSLEGLVYINHYATVSGDVDRAYIEANGGLLIWKNKPAEANATYEKAEIRKAGLVWDEDKQAYGQQTEGIPAKEFADELYLRTYIKTDDGGYVYGDLIEYSVQDYCENRLKNSTNEKMKALAAATLHYGASAQTYFEYHTADLADKAITWPVDTWNADLLNPTVGYTVDPVIPAAGDVKVVGQSLSLEGMVLVNYYFNPASGQTWNVVGGELQVWEDTTNLSGNPTYTKTLAYNSRQQAWGGQSDGFVAKEYGKTIYARAKLVDENGNAHYSSVVTYSPEEYAKGRINNSTNPDMVELAKRLVMYGERARLYFAD